MHSLTLEWKLPFWDKIIQDGHPILVVLSITFIVKSQLSFCQWSLHHHLVSFMIWLKELSKLTKLSQKNFKKVTKVGSILWEESHSNRDHISSSKIHSHSMLNISWAHSLLSIHLIGLKINHPLCIVLPILQNGQLSGYVQVYQLILLLYLLIHLLIPLDKWLIYGQRKMVLTSSKEIIEKPLLGYGLLPQLGTFHSQVSWNSISGKFSHSKFL